MPRPRPLIPLLMLAAPALALPALAAKRKPADAPAAGEGMAMPDLGRVLGSAWTVPPELSDRAVPGVVLELSPGGQRRVLQGCVEGAPQESSVTDVSMQSNLSGGVRWGGGLMEASAAAAAELKINFQAPVIQAYDLIDFKPSAACVAKLREYEARGGDLGRLVLVQEALLARVSGCEQRSVEAGLDLPGGGASAAVGGACQMFSEAPVAVGVKVVEVRGLPEFAAVARAPAPAPAHAPALAPAPTPAPASAFAPAPVPSPVPSVGDPAEYLMVRVPAGSFVMGSPGDEVGRDENEAQHPVTLSRSFWMGATEVTQGLWRSVMGSDPSKFYGDARPVERVSWCDAVAFANRLSAREGLPAAYGGVDRCASSNGTSVVWERSSVGYRLPTEAEWEYAARGGEGHAYAGSGSADAVAWTSGNAWAQTQAVQRKAANGYGLHDMSGNVWEWCWDLYGGYGGASTDPTGAQSGPYRVIRGGSWFDGPAYARVAQRHSDEPGIRDRDLGLRLVRTIP